LSFVPKIIAGGKAADRQAARPAPAKLGRAEIIDINRLSQAFFRIQSTDLRQRIIALIEEIAETEHREILEIY
jgi:hypothetical protein